MAGNFHWKYTCKCKIEDHLKGRIHEMLNLMSQFTYQKFLHKLSQKELYWFCNVCSHLTYIIYPLKEQVIFTISWYVYQFEGNETLLMLPFILKSILSYTTGIIELWTALNKRLHSEYFCFKFPSGA